MPKSVVFVKDGTGHTVAPATSGIGILTITAPMLCRFRHGQRHKHTSSEGQVTALICSACWGKATGIRIISPELPVMMDSTITGRERRSAQQARYRRDSRSGCRAPAGRRLR